MVQSTLKNNAMSQALRVHLRAGDADFLMSMAIAAAANRLPVLVALAPMPGLEVGALLEFGEEMRAVAVRRADRSDYEALLRAAGWRVPAPGAPWEIWELRAD